MSDKCPQCGNPAYLPSDQCGVIWHTGAKPFGTSVVQDIDAQLAEQIEWVKRLADDLIAAEGREARLKAKLAKAVEALSAIDQYGSDTLSGRADGPDDRSWQREGVLEMTRRARTTLAELKGQNDE